MRMIAISTIILILSACNEPNNKSDISATDNLIPNYTKKILSLPENQRNAVFFRAIWDAGLPCQSITRSEKLEADAQAPMWRASCEDGAQHLIQVTPRGTVNIVNHPTPDQG